MSMVAQLIISPLSRLIVFVAISLLVAGGCQETIDTEETSWHLVWQDDFTGLAGTPPDSLRWQFGIGTGWGNNQLEYDTDRPENAALDGNGNLAIVARKEFYRGQSYTSARISTKGRYAFTYGKVEARIHLPSGQGLWPAFWMLGANEDSVPWPRCGEIDVMEYRGQVPTRIYSSVHGPGY